MTGISREDAIAIAREAVRIYMEKQVDAPNQFSVADLLDINQVASLLRCDAETAAKRLNSGDLPGLKFSHSWIIPAAAFYERLNEKAREEAAQRGKAAQPNPILTSQAPAPGPKKRGRKRFELGPLPLA